VADRLKEPRPSLRPCRLALAVDVVVVVPLHPRGHLSLREGRARSPGLTTGSSRTITGTRAPELTSPPSRAVTSRHEPSR
jgi:hypothetical protein